MITRLNAIEKAYGVSFLTISLGILPQN
jgi:hypothetical protein